MVDLNKLDKEVTKLLSEATKTTLAKWYATRYMNWTKHNPSKAYTQHFQNIEDEIAMLRLEHNFALEDIKSVIDCCIDYQIRDRDQMAIK